MRLREWIRDERTHVSTAFRDDFKGITALQIVATISLALAVGLGSVMNVWIYYDGLGPNGFLFFMMAGGLSVMMGVGAFALARIRRPLALVMPAAAILLIYMAEVQKDHFGFYLALTVLPGITGAYGIWRRSMVFLYLGFAHLLSSIFVFSNPIDTPLYMLMPFALMSLLFVEAGHIAITFTRVKTRVLEYQKMTAVFRNFYKRVIKRYAVSASIVLIMTTVLTILFVGSNQLMREYTSGTVTQSLEMNSFTGVFISAAIGLLAISLVRTALPR